MSYAYLSVRFAVIAFHLLLYSTHRTLHQSPRSCRNTNPLNSNPLMLDPRFLCEIVMMKILRKLLNILLCIFHAVRS